MTRVLFVDDVRSILNVAKILLEREGLDVSTAISPKEALEMMEREKFDAIISDYMMPVTNGVEFLKKIRQSGDDTPFILFTGRGKEEVVAEAFNNGTDFYLPKVGKPEAQFTDLTHLINRAIQMREIINDDSGIRVKIKGK